MKFSENVDASRNRIRGYGDGQIYVNNLTIKTPVIVSPDSILTWPCGQITDIDESTLAPALSLAPEMLLIGTGQRLHLLPAPLLARLTAQGIGLEVMDTPAACRTWNLLADEGRRIVAALLPPDQAQNSISAE